ncbi:MAG: alpha-glucan family phosphorylase [Planctomycetes bacterium]|nr:alpha-glucan family phosphorylase [Planctomycetota bacterium]
MSGYTLFEVSWEVGNKVGGIHTVISTKAPTLVEKLGDGYITIGPWLLGEDPAAVPFDADPGFEDFCESCHALGVDARVGRWRIPGAPRMIQVGFSRLFDQKDAILAGLWEDFRVDSLSGGWDYVEPVLFGHAAGVVIERWWEEFIAPVRGAAVAQFHEWMTGSGLLYLKGEVPAIGTVFTTHATALGRSLSSHGASPAAGLNGGQPADLAAQFGIRAKHSLESISAAEADAFTTVSEVTAEEAELLLGREPEPITPNGIDVEVVDQAAGGVGRDEARARLRQIAAAMLGEDLEDAALICTSGRYEFHNKGYDLLLQALQRMAGQDGRPVILFALVPAGNSGPAKELLDRLAQGPAGPAPPLGASTHNLIDPLHDPFQVHFGQLGLDNAHGSRVRVIQVPVYLHGDDGVLGLPYEAVLRAMDLSCFPSFYEPWGYTPVESLAVGVPTITSDCAGFGRWAEDKQMAASSGVRLLRRAEVADEAAAAELARLIEDALAALGDPGRIAEACRKAARSLAWQELVSWYEVAYAAALELAGPRSRASRVRPVLPVPVRGPAEPPGPRLIRFDVSATLPESLVGFEELAANYWWSWDGEAPALFEELAPKRWGPCGHNPTRFLREVFARDVEAMAGDGAFVARLESAVRRQRAYLAERVDRLALDDGRELSWQHPLAYFCLEFGVHESLRIYSGGLGILAGDHLKSASDLNLPLVAVGLYYRKGYLRQGLNQGGEQVPIEEDNDPHDLALTQVRGQDGEPLRLLMNLPGRTLSLRAWRADIGRIPLYLLDADLPENRADDRAITHRLYGGDSEMRLLQEIALGKAGVRLLAALGIEPAVFHLNEGHAAFAPLERASLLIRNREHTFEEAREIVRASTVFTTHTPVPAGHDAFGEDQMRRYFSNVQDWIGLPWERFMRLGDPHGQGSFNMTHLACNLAGFVNGVSELHGEVSRGLLHSEWPGMTEDEVPVGHVTNGVHLASWTDPELTRLLGGERGRGRPADFEQHAATLEAAPLWRFRQRAKRRLLDEIARRVERNFLERQDSPRLMKRITDGLDENALVLGFARRFAPYKRALLLFQDRERLARLLADPERPVLLLFAGKAHPRDVLGQALLKEVVQLSRSDQFAGKLVFLEEYDIELARLLVRGVDLWLNNPTRPLEASGTSGMKVAANGGLNLSVLDGWWLEAYDGENGWALQQERSYPDQELQDQHDNASLLTLLEEEILPLYHDGREDGMPLGWLDRVRHNLATIPVRFNTDRMVGEYHQRAYLPLARRFFQLCGEEGKLAREQAAERAQLRLAFDELRIVSASISDLDRLRTGDLVEVKVEVDLGGTREQELLVELVLGHENGPQRLQLMEAIELELAGVQDGVALFQGSHPLTRSGRWGYGIRVRVRPRDPQDLEATRLVRWA